MSTEERLSKRLRAAFLLGYEPPRQGAAESMVREAIAGWPGRQRAARDRTARRATAVFAGALAVAVVATLVTLRIGSSLSHARHLGRGGSPSVTVPATTRAAGTTPDLNAAIVYHDPAHWGYLERIDYAGHHRGLAWLLPGRSITPSMGGIGGVVEVSPDGAYVVTMDSGGHGFLFVGASGTLGSSLSPSSLPLSVLSLPPAWADDSRHVCQVSIDASGQPRLVVADIRISPPEERSVPIDGLQYPQSTAVTSCSVRGDRAVLVEDLTADRSPGPGGTAPVVVLVVQLSSGRVTGQVMHGPAVGSVVSLDGRYLAEVDAQRQTSTIVDLTTMKTVEVEHRAVRGFSADDSRVVEDSRFQTASGGDPGTTLVVDWRSGQVLFARPGSANSVRTRPGSADVAIDVTRTSPTGEPGGTPDLVIVPTAGPPIVLPGLVSY